MDKLYEAMIEASRPALGLLPKSRTASNIVKLHDLAMEHGWSPRYQIVRMRDEGHTVTVAMCLSREGQAGYAIWSTDAEGKFSFRGGCRKVIEPGVQPTFPTLKAFRAFIEGDSSD